MSFFNRLFGKKSFAHSVGERGAPLIAALQHQVRGVSFEVFCKNEIAIGYVHGCAQTLAKEAGAKDGAEIVKTVLVIFQELFDEKRGVVLWAISNKMVPLAKEERTNWTLGFEGGGADTHRFLETWEEKNYAVFPPNLYQTLQYNA